MKRNAWGLLSAVVFLGFLWVAYQWLFCRFYVRPGEMAVVIAKTGESLPPGQILARKGQKGIQEEVLGEGRHFRDVFLYDVEVRKAITIPPGKIGIVTSKVGSDLPPGEFLAEPGQKGIWRRVLGPGRYRMNPYGYQVEIVDALSIPIGFAGVVTSLSGKPTPNGEFASPGEKGVRADILQPGLYYANPKEFRIDVLEIGINQVSLLGREGGAVVTKKAALQPEASGAVSALQAQAIREQRERRKDYLESRVTSEALKASGDKTRVPPAPLVSEQKPAPATLEKSPPMVSPSERAGWTLEMPPPRVSPREQARAAVEKPHPAVEAAVSGFVLDQFVTFPSREGFEINLDMTVEFELRPESVAWIFRQFGDLPAVVDKILMPQILSVSRLKGSAYRATDFIVGEGREKFQVDLKDTLAKTLAERQILIHNALIRHVNVPDEILEPIQQASIAQEQDLTNQEKQNTARKQAQLNTEQSLIQQRGAEVAQQTERIKAVIQAEQQKSVAEIAGETLKKVSEIEKSSAEIRARKTLRLGQANAEVVRKVEGEKAKGLLLRTRAFGDPAAFSLWEFANGLSPELTVRIIHAGQGTLWTDLEKATLGELGGAAVLEKLVP